MNGHEELSRENRTVRRLFFARRLSPGGALGLPDRSG